MSDFWASLIAQLVKNLPAVQETWILATLWTVAHQAPLSMGFSKQDYWSGLLCPYPGDLPDSGIESYIAGKIFTLEPCG